MMHKKRLVFDVAQLLEGAVDAGSGIFYVALNLFKEFSKNKNIELVLYSSCGNVGVVQKWLKQKTGQNFECIGLDKLDDFIFIIRQKKKFYKKNKKYFRKIIFGFVLIFLKILHAVKHFLTCSPKVTGDIYFSPSHAVPKHIDIKKKIFFCTIQFR